MGRTDVVTQWIPASPDRVFAAFTDNQALESWLPPTGMSCRVLELDLRPGGHLRLLMRYLDARGAPGKSTADADIVSSSVLEVVPGVRLVQAVEFEQAGPEFVGQMVMTWSAVPAPGGSDVEFRADNVPRGILEGDHRKGMSDSLAQLAAYLA
ncbi:SRPBCC domain-containing protein [Arthrobacter sp. JSM 101049]|uniref:SRPBCC domain-containing protein n=1 Tax=Arthrobacter sp. JSM 101049 TaxID=929097 RepID=UPI0035616530